MTRPSMMRWSRAENATKSCRSSSSVTVIYCQHKETFWVNVNLIHEKQVTNFVQKICWKFILFSSYFQVYIVVHEIHYCCVKWSSKMNSPCLSLAWRDSKFAIIYRQMSLYQPSYQSQGYFFMTYHIPLLYPLNQISTNLPKYFQESPCM